ncbi:hypothetical protein [Riemerella anatipestifer]|uniref:hypothetical protein n=1 Tax=Riemerella anatipestifer TaxID=34085 RepID=UPI0021D5BB6B|nr:hypothetical protein [Riemerella anatipestifer]MCU7543242.1 hypothetical protein [Riemerella anatipestifer]MCW0514056.1 hypothetical protein [Riemerella anatipestifer]
MKTENPELIVFQEDEIALGYKYLSETKNLPSDIEIKSYEYDLEKVRNEFHIIGGNPRLQTVLYKHPYQENTYINGDIDNIESFFLKEKLNLYMDFGRLLGAKSINVKVTSFKSEEREMDASGEVKYKVVNIDSSYKKEEEKKLTSTIEISKEYEKSDNFNLCNNIDELKKRIDNLNLYHETELVSLVRERDSRDGGVFNSKTRVKSTITSEYRRASEFAFNLAATPVFELNSKVKNSVKNVNEIEVDIEFIF